MALNLLVRGSDRSAPDIRVVTIFRNGEIAGEGEAIDNRKLVRLFVVGMIDQGRRRVWPIARVVCMREVNFVVPLRQGIANSFRRVAPARALC